MVQLNSVCTDMILIQVWKRYIKGSLLDGSLSLSSDVCNSILCVYFPYINSLHWLNEIYMWNILGNEAGPYKE